MITVAPNEGRSRPKMIPGGLNRKPDATRIEPVFDQWLTHHLERLYDPVVQEPIPAELLRLLELRLK